MKKINQTLAALLLVLTVSAPGLASPLGVRVAIPEGWKCVQDEQVLIYNRSETAAVIIDQVGKNNGESEKKGHPPRQIRRTVHGIHPERRARHRARCR